MSHMDRLPVEILIIILAQYCNEYIPLVRRVCASWNTVTFHACRSAVYQHYDKVEFDVLFLRFASRGHMNVLEWIRQCLRKYVDWENVAAAAARAGHEHMVRLCLDKYGAERVNWIMSNAATGGHEPIVRLCRDEYHADDVDSAMAFAASEGHEHIVRLCHDTYGAKNVNNAIEMAARNGQILMVRLCKETYGADSVNDALVWAAMSGHMAIVRLMVDEYGARKDNIIAIHCARNAKHYDILEYLEGGTERND